MSSRDDSPLLRKTRQFLSQRGTENGGMVVAVSGGPDSVALLRALVELRFSIVNGPLVVAHLNHLLRGPESNADEEFVRGLVASLAGENISLRSERIDVAAHARSEKENLESSARRLRYEWLTKVARETGALYVATGHTADDQAETVLHRLLRGTGLRGLRGIAARRPLASGIELVRPLLHVTRAEVIEYLASLGQEFCHDRTNLDLEFTRNRIRHELLPLLAKNYNPEIVDVLARVAEQADAVWKDAEALARQLLAEAERPRAGELLVFDKPRLASAPRNLIREVFRFVWEREGWPRGEMNFASWDRIAGVIMGEMTAVDLPGGIRVRGLEKVVQVRVG